MIRQRSPLNTGFQTLSGARAQLMPSRKSAESTYSAQKTRALAEPPYYPDLHVLTLTPTELTYAFENYPLKSLATLMKPRQGANKPIQS